MYFVVVKQRVLLQKSLLNIKSAVKNKWLRWGILSLSGLAALYVLALVIMQFYAGSKKVQMLAIINQVLRDNINGNASIEDIEINGWRYFPYIEVRLVNVSVKDSLNKPLLSAGSVATTFSLIELAGKKKKLDNIIVKEGLFHLYTNANGYTNKYLLQLKKQADTGQPAAKGKQTVDIRTIEAEDVELLIEDESKNKKFELTVNELEAHLTRKGPLLFIDAEEACTMKAGLGFNLERGSYLQNSKLEAEWKLKLDIPAKNISFDKTELEINGQDFTMAGFFDFSAKAKFGLQFETKEIDYGNALAILTSSVRGKLQMLQVDEPLDVKGQVEGSLLPHTIPFVKVSWSTQYNRLQTPVIEFTDCGFTGSYTNEVIKGVPRTDANSRVVFDKFSGNWDGIQTSGSGIAINNLETPVLQLNLQANSDLENLDSKFALKTLKFISGKARFDMHYTGPLKADKSIIENATGNLHVQDGVITYLPRNFTFTNCSGTVNFLEDSIMVNQLRCRYRQNNFLITGHAANIRKHNGLQDSTKASIYCDVYSPFVNLKDFSGLFSTPVQTGGRRKVAGVRFARTATTVDNLLEKGALQVNMNADSLKHGLFTAGNLRGSIVFSQHNWEIPSVSFRLADGMLNARGSVQNAGAGARANLTVNMHQMNVQKLFYAFNEFGQDGITSQNIRGVLQAGANITTAISDSGSLVTNSLKGTVDFSLRDGELLNFEPLIKLKNFILKNKEVNDVKFAELKNRLQIEGDKIYISRMEIQSTVLSMFIEGVYGTRGNTDLLIQLPMSNLNRRDKTYNPQNIGVNAKVGPSIRVRAVSGDDGDLKFKLTFSRKTKDR
ncbi:AsmA-like C-terminal region-containing protein [Foetidibacter luteolus]|uniref:AsmA-like C-terminal region-containing protein n=1 Tax=Foetidibacter luteolus TaxID=2608880 RepID=UPI00129ACDC8|nr:AsmA-like C-terminal region-containing protein [Foetidibacter luteolus]